MAFILRKLDRKASFYPRDWLDDDDAQADALSSLRTKDNRLSVWRIDEDRGNLHRVVAAPAAGRDFLDKLDYAVIDLQALDSLGIQAGVRTAFPDQVDAPVLRVTITASSATAP